MNSPRSPMSGVFVSNIPEPKKRRPKAPNSCYPTQARGREEISRSYCASPSVPGVFRRSPREASPVPPPKPQALRRSLQPGQSPSSPAIGTASQSRIPRPSRSTNDCSSAEAAKTISAIDGALNAVEAIMTKSNLASNDSSPSASEDLESLCGTECTESTACSSSLSEMGVCRPIGVMPCLRGKHQALSPSLKDEAGPILTPSLKDARRTLKECIGAEERSMKFNSGLLAKLDELREAVAEETGSPKAKTARSPTSKTARSRRKALTAVGRWI
jgi:hypothetical protein